MDTYFSSNCCCLTTPINYSYNHIQPQLDHQERCPSSGRTALARRLLRGVTDVDVEVGFFIGKSTIPSGKHTNNYPIGSMYGICANIWGILMVNVTIYGIHGSYGYGKSPYLIGKLTINGPFVNSYVKLPEGKWTFLTG